MEAEASPCLLTRRLLVQAGWAAFTALVASALPDTASAAVPTLDEYAGGQGSVKRSGGSFLLDQSKQASKTSSGAAALQTPQTLEETKETIARAADILDVDARKLIERKAWDDLFALLSTGECGAILLLNNSVVRGKLLPAYGGEKTQSVALVLADLRTAVQALKDRAFGNRVVFFNSADRRNVEMLAKEEGYDVNSEEVQEALAYLNDALMLARQALRAI